MEYRLSRTTYTRLTCALFIAFVAHSAQAVISQSVIVSFSSVSGVVIAQSQDHFYSPPEPLRTVLAQISGTGYEVVSSAGPFGNLGMQGWHEAPGQLHAEVNIRNSEIFNPFGVPLIAHANFLIDGGSMRFSGGPDSGLGFSLELFARIHDSIGRTLEQNIWKSYARLTCESFAPPQLQLDGADIGIHMTDPYMATIPSSFQTFVIGIVPAGGWVDLSYYAAFHSLASALEFSEFQYSDPLNVSGEGEFPTVEFVPVPEPGTLLAFGAALLALPRRRGKSWLTFRGQVARTKL